MGMEDYNEKDLTRAPPKKKQQENGLKLISFNNIPDDQKVPTIRKVIGETEDLYRQAEKTRIEAIDALSSVNFNDQIQTWERVGDVLDEFPAEYSTIPGTGRAYLKNLYYTACSGQQIAEDHYTALEKTHREYLPPPFYTSSETSSTNIAQTITVEALYELADDPAFRSAREKWKYGKRIQKNVELEILLQGQDSSIAHEFSELWKTYQEGGELSKILYSCHSKQPFFNRVLDTIAPIKNAEEQPYAHLAKERWGSLGIQIVFAICGENLIDLQRLPLMSFFTMLENMNQLFQQLSKIKTQPFSLLDKETQFNIASYLEMLQSLLLDLLTQRKNFAPEYLKVRLFPEDIDNFKKIVEVTPEMVSQTAEQVSNWAEKDIKSAFESIIGEKYSKKDWGGEGNDLFTWNVKIRGISIPAAFLLKGRAIQSQKLRIRDCGKNGDQIVRLFDAPAELFVVQYIRGINEELIKDVQDKVLVKRAQKKRAWCLIMNGQDTARLLMAYRKIPPSK